MLLSPGCCCCCFGSFLYTSFTLLWWDANLVKGHFSRSPTVRMPVGPFAILQYVCHMPQSGVSIYAGTCMRCVCVCASMCVCLCVILMQITFPVFELQLVDTCVRVRLFVSVCVCVCVSLCAYFACRHTFSTKYYTILLKKSTTDDDDDGPESS